MLPDRRSPALTPPVLRQGYHAEQLKIPHFSEITCRYRCINPGFVPEWGVGNVKDCFFVDRKGDRPNRYSLS
ncbi:MAG: hypothetical protein GDA43_03070 [Hormoscilla sp. SP5CHS1]|nr:hypothetical protein [Hormoscilla sp. SP12CHS1]MBC6452295.1 hypothetical protein [Hormoscilla sp. SP5CHS1]MBC6475577.1 hypothetical protein [Hormoscilla sp. GM102CHS1]